MTSPIPVVPQPTSTTAEQAEHALGLFTNLLVTGGEDLEYEYKIALIAATLPAMRKYLADCGPCDHDADVCTCGLQDVVREMTEAVKNAGLPAWKEV